MTTNINKICLNYLNMFQVLNAIFYLNQFSTTCYFCTLFTKFYLTHLAKLTEKEFTAVPYIFKGNLLYFSHRDLTTGSAFTFLRILDILSRVKIIVSGIYCYNKSILAKNI